MIFMVDFSLVIASAERARQHQGFGLIPPLRTSLGKDTFEKSRAAQNQKSICISPWLFVSVVPTKFQELILAGSRPESL